MNGKRYISASILVLIFVFLYEWLVHGVILTKLYAQTPNLWRAHAVMQHYAICSIVALVLFSLFFAGFFVATVQKHTTAAGLRFGCWMGLLVATMALGFYVMLPISASLAAAWAITGFIEMLIAGAIVGGVYKK